MLDLLEAGSPQDRAFIMPDAGSWSFRDLRLLRDEAALLMPGERAIVLFCTDRRAGGLVVYLASLAAGHVAAWLPCSMTTAQLAEALSAFTPEYLVITANQAVRWAPALQPRGYDCTTHLGVVLASRRHARDDAVPGDVALLLRTSGVTGAPKMVQLSGAGVAANTAAIMEALRLSPRSRAVTSLPMHYTYGLSVLHSHLFAGGSLVVTDRPASGRSFWRAVASHRCTSFAGVPQSLEWLCHNLRAHPDLPIPPILTSSGGALRRVTVLALDALCRSRRGAFYAMYGQTEATARITVLPPEATCSWPDSVGVPIGDWDVAVTDASGARLPEPVIGRVTVRGCAVMRGYARSRTDLGKTDAQPTSGTLDTGDLGFLRSGYLHLTGRSSRVIKPSGVRVALDDVERDLGEVANVAVSGRADESAVVFHEVGADVDELTRRWTELASSLGVSADVVAFRAVSRLPTNDRGKVDHRALMIDSLDVTAGVR